MNDPYMMVGNGFDVPAMPVHPGGADMARMASGLEPAPGAPPPCMPPPKPPKPEPFPPQPRPQPIPPAAKDITFDMNSSDWEMRQDLGTLIRRLGGKVIDTTPEGE